LVTSSATKPSEKNAKRRKERQREQKGFETARLGPIHCRLESSNDEKLRPEASAQRTNLIAVGTTHGQNPKKRSTLKGSNFISRLQRECDYAVVTVGVAHGYSISHLRCDRRTHRMLRKQKEKDARIYKHLVPDGTKTKR
jgi:hypothetical protein